MRRRLRLLPGLLFVLLWAIPAMAPAQSVRGRVLDAGTRQPIAGVHIELRNARDIVVAATVTRDDGIFHLAVRNPGPHRIGARHIAYTDLEAVEVVVRPAELLTVDLTLDRRAIPLEPLTVTGRRADPRREATYDGLYARHAILPPIGNRRVILWDEPEMQTSNTVNELLNWFAGRRGCIIVYWNGRVVDDLAWTRYWIDEFSTSMIEGVEYYRRFDDAPSPFRIIPMWIRDPTRLIECSVIAIWPLRAPAFRGRGGD